jgi:hypothetical protein
MTIQRRLMSLSRLAVAATTLTVFLPMAAHAQYSSPIHDVDNPARQPFQIANMNLVFPSLMATGRVLTTVPANKVLVVEYISAFCDNTAGLSSLASVDPSNTQTGNQYLFGLNDNNKLSTPIRLYVKAGERLEVIIDNNVTPATLNCNFNVTGYYVNVP